MTDLDKFEAYFRRADLDGDARISGAEALAFFQGSNLSNSVLAQIWNHADQKNAGFLEKGEFYNALRLVTVAQSGRELRTEIVKAALYGPAAAKIPAPQIHFPATSAPHELGPTATSAAPQMNSALGFSSFASFGISDGVGSSTSDNSQLPWPDVKLSDARRYMEIFMKIDTDKDGKITGEQARHEFLSWLIPREVLKQVWDLSDQDDDGMLSSREFCFALYLMERYSEGRPLPAALPSNIMYDEKLALLTGQPEVTYENSVGSHIPGFGEHQGMQVSEMVAPVTGLKPAMQAFPAEWSFLVIALCLEILSICFDQASSPSKPRYALYGMLLAIAALLTCIWELIHKGRKERVILRRWGKMWWFYYPSPRYRLFGSLPDIYGLVGGISQCICSTVQYVCFIRHDENPIKVSLWPAIFLICLGASRLNLDKTDETSQQDD